MTKKLCRLCTKQTWSYYLLGENEISKMFQALIPKEYRATFSDLICVQCLLLLKSAYKFQQQVIDSFISLPWQLGIKPEADLTFDIEDEDAELGTDTEMCQICGNDTPTKCLNTHLNKHFTTNQDCSICFKKLLNVKSLRYHWRWKHNNENPLFECLNCGLTFQYQSMYDLHITNVCYLRTTLSTVTSLGSKTTTTSSGLKTATSLSLKTRTSLRSKSTPVETVQNDKPAPLIMNQFCYVRTTNSQLESLGWHTNEIETSDPNQNAMFLVKMRKKVRKPEKSIEVEPKADTILKELLLKPDKVKVRKKVRKPEINVEVDSQDDKLQEQLDIGDIKISEPDIVMPTDVSIAEKSIEVEPQEEDKIPKQSDILKIALSKPKIVKKHKKLIRPKRRQEKNNIQKEKAIEDIVLSKPKIVKKRKKIIKPEIHPEEDNIQEEIDIEDIKLLEPDIVRKSEKIMEVKLQEDTIQEELDIGDIVLSKPDIAQSESDEENKDDLEGWIQFKVDELFPPKELQIKSGLCHCCGLWFKNVRQHVNRSHNPQRKFFMCELCPKKFAKNNVLRVHVQRHHKDIKDFMCHTCGTEFYQKKDLMKHIRIKHLKLRPFICTYCKKGFSGRTALTCHIRLHTHELPFRCDICCAGFPVRVSLKNHLRSKHGIADKITCHCKKCGKGFPTPVSLYAHMRVHF